jgi:hypothetical protein
MAKTKKRKTSVIVQNFGLFWKKKYVNWEKKQLIGKQVNVKSRGEAVNFWEQKGIYVLYKEFEPIYVGQVGLKKEGGNNLGSRLRAHDNNIDMGEKWDSFSWFGVMPLSTKAPPRYPKGHHTRFDTDTPEEVKKYEHPRTLIDEKRAIIEPEELVTLLEAVVISLFGGTIQNKQEGGWRSLNIKRYHQDQDSLAALYALRRNNPLEAGVLATIQGRVNALSLDLKKIQESVVPRHHRTQSKDLNLADRLLKADTDEERLIVRTIRGLKIKEKGKPNSKLFRELSDIKKKIPQKSKKHK